MSEGVVSIRDGLGYQKPLPLSALRAYQQSDQLDIDGDVLALWAPGHDTAEIARRLGQPEGLVASRVPRVLERQRLRRYRG